MRLFIAIQFSPEILDALVGVQSELKSFDVRGRYSPPENLHLTLAFIGEYGDPDRVLETMRGVPFSTVQTCSPSLIMSITPEARTTAPLF